MNKNAKRSIEFAVIGAGEGGGRVVPWSGAGCSGSHTEAKEPLGTSSWSVVALQNAKSKLTS